MRKVKGNMKTIILMPTKNEDWILPTTLKAAEQFADIIIVGDQMSDDNTRKILEESCKIEIIDNTEIGHSNKIRWRMLDYMRDRYGIDNFVINLDADEILPPYLFNKNKQKLLEYIEPGTIISSPWVQVWRTVDTYRKDNSVWNPFTNKKPFMFLDNGIMDYERNFVINDHTSRVPEKNSKETLEIKIPLLHLQFANWNRTQIKQAWYQCCEVLKGKDAKIVGQNYKITNDESGLGLCKIPSVWYQNIEVPSTLEQCDISDTWYFLEIKEMFKQFGIDKFKDLKIWHISELKELINE